MSNQLYDKTTDVMLISKIQDKVTTWHQNQVKRTASRCSYKSCTCIQILDPETGAIKPKGLIKLEIVQFNNKVVNWHETQVIQKQNRCSYGTCTCLQIIDSEIGAFNGKNIH